MEFRKILMIILGVIFLIVLVQNLQPITVEFLFWERDVPQIIMLFLSALLGFIICYIWLHIRGRRRRI